jgi:hypothetical protein
MPLIVIAGLILLGGAISLGFPGRMIRRKRRKR